MPYPIEDDRERLIDLLPPNERLLFEALERQIEVSQTMIRAYKRVATIGCISLGLLVCGLLAIVQALVWAGRCG